jgi:AcrR family transcriptional regulator
MTTEEQDPEARDWRKSPVQERSREAEKNLAKAARELLALRPYDQIRVEEVARRAGVSVGGFYGRFRGKSALLHLADTDFLDACREAFDRALPEDFHGTPREIFSAFVSVMVEQFSLHREAVIQAWRHAEAGDEAGFGARAAVFNEHVHGRVRRLLRPFHPAIRHPDPAMAVDMAIFMLSSAARDAVIRGSLTAHRLDLDGGQLTEELVRFAVAYLTGEME